MVIADYFTDPKLTVCGFFGKDMDLASFRALHPAAFMKRFLDEGVRPDGRTVDATRRVTVTAGTIGTANGSALVRVGSTAVVAGVVALVTFPLQTSPSSGILETNVHMSALCGRQFHAHRPAPDALAASEFLRRTLIGYARAVFLV